MSFLWDCTKWKKRYRAAETDVKTGLRFRFEKGVDPWVREICLEFGKWLRQEYLFPVRLNVYVKAAKRILAMDGELVCGTCWRPDDPFETPYFKIATGDYSELCEQRGKISATAEILLAIAHELTHYYQWLNGIELTPVGEERQAARYADIIVSDFYDDSDGFHCEQEKI